MEEKIKHREWVKNAAIVFLSVLLVLTFFSNTIMNRTLPEVAAKQASSGNIVALVRVSGKAEADGSYDVKSNQTRIIRSVMVKSGDEVAPGDVLFVLGEGDSEELEAAKDTLRTLQSSYQRAALSMQNHDYTLENREIERAREKLDEAQARLDEINQRIQEESPATEEELNNALGARDKANEVLAELELRHENAVKEAEETMNAAWEVYETEHAKLQALIDDETRDKTDTAYIEEYNAAVESDQSAEASYQDAKEKYAALVNNTDPAITAAQAEAERLEYAYNQLVNPTGKYDGELKSAVQAVNEATDYKLTLEKNLEQKQRSDAQSDTLTAIELSDISTQIEKQKQKINELSGGGDNEITADVSGIVTSVNITAGHTAMKGDVICTIEVPDLGYSLTATVTGDQARRLRVGDTATVSNYYWGSQIVATLKSIQNDPKNPQQSKLLTFSLTGDVNAGSELKLSVGSKSANYDVVIPNSAIRSDSNGSFVLVISEKSSALGNRYFATREPIEVLASDDSFSAVSGGVEAGSFVITTSSKPVNAGDQVRMAD